MNKKFFSKKVKQTLCSDMSIDEFNKSHLDNYTNTKEILKRLGLNKKDIDIIMNNPITMQDSFIPSDGKLSIDDKGDLSYIHPYGIIKLNNNVLTNYLQGNVIETLNTTKKGEIIIDRFVKTPSIQKNMRFTYNSIGIETKRFEYEKRQSEKDSSIITFNKLSRTSPATFLEQFSQYKETDGVCKRIFGSSNRFEICRTMPTKICRSSNYVLKDSEVGHLEAYDLRDCSPEQIKYFTPFVLDPKNIDKLLKSKSHTD